MKIQELFKQELMHEQHGIIKTLQRVDFNQADWKPHDKSMAFLALATHVAALCDWPARIIAHDMLDFATEDFAVPPIQNKEDLVAYAQKNIDKSLAAFDTWADADVETVWTLKHGDYVIIQASKAIAIRT